MSCFIQVSSVFEDAVLSLKVSKQIISAESFPPAEKVLHPNKHFKNSSTGKPNNSLLLE